MLPIKDENPTRTKPILTVALILVNATIFFASYFSGRFEQIVSDYGLRPAELLRGERLHTLLTSMFLHGGFIHIFGNMLYLWIFGDNIEDVLGRPRFMVFYLAAGVAAAFAHAAFNPGSTVPTIGASGAISGVLGAYLVLYPGARVLTFVYFFYFIRLVMVPAIFFLGFWFLLQVLGASLFTLAGAPTGVAYWAHVGGFVAGAALILPLRLRAGRGLRPPTY